MFRKAIILLALTTFVSGKVVSWNNSNFAENDLEVVSCSDGSHCPNGNTCCHRKDGSYTCCPLTNGVCCIGGNTCCPSNTRCDSEGGHCLSENETFPQNGTVAVSTFMKAIQHKVNQEIVGREFQGSKGINNFGKNDLEVEYCTDGSYCPSGNTCCLRRDGEFGCCPRLNGVCCIGGLTCCPAHTRCDTSGSQCLRVDNSVASTFIETIKQTVDQEEGIVKK